MPRPNVTVSDLKTGLSRSAGQTHQLVLDQRIVDRIEVDDVSFHFNSPVLLPAPSDVEGNPDGGGLAGLVVIARVLAHAAEASGKEVIVAGHTDTVGSAGANLTLSERRANNVMLYLKGDRDAWARSCEQFQARDVQQVLRWISHTHGFDCDPQSTSGELDTRTVAARRRFRHEHNQRFNTRIPVQGAQSAADWSAYFGLYEKSLATLMQVEVADLASKRSAITFANPAVLACGEHWPIDGVGIDERRSATNRRVEVLFYEPGTLTDQTQTTPPGLDLYGPNPAFRLRTVRLDMPAQVRVVDAAGEVLANVTLLIEMADGTPEEHTTDGDGMVSLPPVPGHRYRVVGIAPSSSDIGAISSAQLDMPVRV